MGASIVLYRSRSTNGRRIKIGYSTPSLICGLVGVVSFESAEMLRIQRFLTASGYSGSRRRMA